MEKIEVKLTLLSYIDENVHIIYSPALDLYGYGNDESEARDSFAVTLDEYLAFTTLQDLFTADLNRLGWHVDPESHRLVMPLWTDLIAQNEHLNEVVTDRPFKKFDQQLRLLIFA